MRQNDFGLLISELRYRYPFTKDVSIETIDGMGATGYRRRVGSIVVFLETLKDLWRSDRLSHRIRSGHAMNFYEFMTFVLLHEIRHVWQATQLGEDRMHMAALRIQAGLVDHDDDPLEKDADRFARRELKKINCTNSVLRDIIKTEGRCVHGGASCSSI